MSRLWVADPAGAAVCAHGSAAAAGSNLIWGGAVSRGFIRSKARPAGASGRQWLASRLPPNGGRRRD